MSKLPKKYKNNNCPFKDFSSLKRHLFPTWHDLGGRWQSSELVLEGLYTPRSNNNDNISGNIKSPASSNDNIPAVKEITV